MNGLGAKAILPLFIRPKVDQTYVRLTADEVVRLELIVESMRRANPRLTADECIDAVFACGLAMPIEQMEIAAQLMGGDQ